MEELIEKAKQNISNNGYGTDSNFTVNSVAYLMANFAREQALSLTDVSICDSCKFKGCHNLYDSPCNALNECENTCGNYNEH